MLHVTEAEYIKDYQIKISFDDGSSGVIDLKDHLEGAMFESLQEIENFKTVKFSPELGTISWENGADLAPEFLREIME
ncbi:MAG: DUF2442 domain-containing protein [Candidatus Caenarcaniphilales bacterium]|nr:DUF2442 domain-containing protein [Candidatus Caenarcaniphilales bacterium]